MIFLPNNFTGEFIGIKTILYPGIPANCKPEATEFWGDPNKTAYGLCIEHVTEDGRKPYKGCFFITYWKGIVYYDSVDENCSGRKQVLMSSRTSILPCSSQIPHSSEFPLEICETNTDGNKYAEPYYGDVGTKYWHKVYCCLK